MKAQVPHLLGHIGIFVWSDTWFLCEELCDEIDNKALLMLEMIFCSRDCSESKDPEHGDLVAR